MKKIVHQKTMRHRDFILRWEEPPDGDLAQNHTWSIEVSSDYPQLMAKLRLCPERFVAATRDRAMAEAVGFVDSLSLT
jgi:hypothetical protein